MAIGTLLLLVSGYLLMRAFKMGHDPRPSPGPETLSAAS
jgi:hypothetical protein